MPIQVTKQDNRKHGKRGLPGKPGKQGERGAPGLNGKDGADGIDGSVWYSGDGSPEATLGAPGDFYLDNDTYDYYEKTTRWVKRGNLQGAKGEKGERGEKGSKGDRGERGFRGVPGRDGGVGTPGADGAPGAQGPQGMQGAQGIQGNPGVGVPTGGTTGQYLVKDSDTDYDTEWVDLPVQTYTQFIYDSSETSPHDNIYNDELALIADLQKQGGLKAITVRQDEHLYEVYPGDDVIFLGNGLEYNAGGFTIYFEEGSGITGSLWRGASSVRVYNNATTHSIYYPTLPWLVRSLETANIHSLNVPFISSSAVGQNIINASANGRFNKLAGGVENVEFTGAAYTQQPILAIGEGAFIGDDVLKSTNAVIFIQVLQTVVGDPANFNTTQTNLNIGVPIKINQTFAENLFYDNSVTGVLSATEVQGALDQLSLGLGDLYTNAARKTSANDLEITDTTKGVILKSPDGSRFRISVSDLGVLTATEI